MIGAIAGDVIGSVHASAGIAWHGTGGAEVMARFRDPGGNVLGLYQQPR